MSLRIEIIPVTAFQQNCSLVWCDSTNEAALIDPGGDTELLLERVGHHGLNLTQIFITHAHIDHAGAAADIAEAKDIPIIGPHRADQFWIDKLSDQSRMFQFPEARPFVPQRWLDQGDEVQVGKETMQVFHCPGHTPGHVVFYHPTIGLLFVGDVLFQNSIGRTDFPQSDHGALIQSIQNHLLVLDDQVQFVPGHGPVSTIGQERKHNPFLT
ncbi:MAG: MBL fold metallo-hydrolase [Gammaproteobacteria bacterium]|jgi:glyoxylase-like metal-dependent hydrolase (beta-lactamase superfamily II)|nr:MBL fold metallo-hydrolase [Gammaproteobacteria bacterium]